MSFVVAGRRPPQGIELHGEFDFSVLSENQTQKMDYCASPAIFGVAERIFDHDKWRSMKVGSSVSPRDARRWRALSWKKKVVLSEHCVVFSMTNQDDELKTVARSNAGQRHGRRRVRAERGRRRLRERQVEGLLLRRRRRRECNGDGRRGRVDGPALPGGAVNAGDDARRVGRRRRRVRPRRRWRRCSADVVPAGGGGGERRGAAARAAIGGTGGRRVLRVRGRRGRACGRGSHELCCVVVFWGARHSSSDGPAAASYRQCVH